MLSQYRVASVSAEYSDERNDRAYGSYRQRLFVSRIRYLSFLDIYVLHFDGLRCQSCQIQKTRKPRTVRCQGSECSRRHDVRAWSSNRDDFELFSERQCFFLTHDEHRDGCGGLFRRNSYRRFYAYQIPQNKIGGILDV